MINKNSSFTTSLFSFLILLTLVITSSCEDVIDVELDPAESQLVVDAWLTDQPTNQVIHLTQSQAYFDNSQVAGVIGAAVQVTRDDGGCL